MKPLLLTLTYLLTNTVCTSFYTVTFKSFYWSLISLRRKPPLLLLLVTMKQRPIKNVGVERINKKLKGRLGR